MLKYLVTNLTTGAVRIFSTAADAKGALDFGDDDISPEMIDTLFGEDAMTEVDDVHGVRYRVELKQDPSPPGDGGRRKSSRKKQMRTRKHGGSRRAKTVKRVVGKYTEAPRARSVFQMEGGRKHRRSHRRL